MISIWRPAFTRSLFTFARSSLAPSVATIRSDAASTSVARSPVTITDLHATLFTAMGISPKTAFDVENRPFYATEDGKGRAVEALFGA